MSQTTQDPWAGFIPVMDSAPAQPQASDPWAGFIPVQEAQPAAAPQSLGERVMGRIAPMAGSAVRGVARGVTLGFADELAGVAGGVGNMIGGDGFSAGYQRYRDAGRALNERDDRTNPISATIGQVGGAVLTPMGPLGRFAAGGASVPGAMLRGATVGAGLGAVSGFGEGEGGLENRIGSATRGAAFGAAVGGAVPAAISAGSALGGVAGRQMGLSNPAASAERLLLRDLGRDGLTPEQVLTRAREAGSAPVALADLGGENVAGAAQAVSRLPGRGQTAAREMLEARGGAAQGERLASAVRQHFSGADFRTTADDLIVSRAQASTPAYERAFAESGPVDVAPIIAGIDQRIGTAKGSVGGALQRARSFLLANGSDAPDTSIRGLHEAKLAIDDMLSGGADTAIGRVARRELVGIQKQLVEAMDQASTVDGQSLYATARAAFAGPSAMLDAMEAGRRLLREGPQAAELTAREIASFTPSEREMFRLGTARGLLDRIENSADAAEQTRLRQVFQTPAIRTRLRAAFESDAEFNAFSRQLEQEISIARINRAVNPSGGSQTMPLGERRADLASPPVGPVAGALTNADRADFGGPSAGVMRDVAQSITTGGALGPVGRLMERGMEASRAGALERNVDQLAPMLFTTDSGRRMSYAESLVARAQEDARRRGQVAPLARGLLGGGAISGGLLSN